MDIKEFLYRNKLKQVDLAKYLGVTEASISRMVKGLVKPSKENLTKILNNPHGWDTSMLISGDIYAGNNNAGDVSVQIGHQNQADNRPKDEDAATQLAVLKKENQMLREQIEFMKTLMKTLIK